MMEIIRAETTPRMEEATSTALNYTREEATTEL